MYMSYVTFEGYFQHFIDSFSPVCQFFSGTHAITCALFAFLRPGDEVS